MEKQTDVLAVRNGRIASLSHGLLRNHDMAGCHSNGARVVFGGTGGSYIEMGRSGWLFYEPERHRRWRTVRICRAHPVGRFFDAVRLRPRIGRERRGREALSFSY